MNLRTAIIGVQLIIVVLFGKQGRAVDDGSDRIYVKERLDGFMFGRGLDVYCDIPCHEPKAITSNPVGLYELVILCSTGLYILDRDCGFSLLHDECINDIYNETFVNAKDVIAVRGTTMIVVAIGACHVAYIDMTSPENCQVAYANPDCTEHTIDKILPDGKLSKVGIISTGPSKLYLHPGDPATNMIFILLFSNKMLTKLNYPQMSVSAMTYTLDPAGHLFQEGDNSLRRIKLDRRSDQYFGTLYGYMAPYVIDIAVDGFWNETKFVGKAVKLEMPNTNTILLLDMDGSIRVLDIIQTTSRSICHSVNYSSPILGPVDQCAFPHGEPKDLYTVPELNSILVLSGRQILAFGYHRPLEGCSGDEDCTTFCNREISDAHCMSRIQYICDPVLKHCVTTCSQNSRKCPIDHVCENRVSISSGTCIMHCVVHEDCPNNGVCTKGRCCTNEYCFRKPDVCMKGCRCFFSSQEELTFHQTQTFCAQENPSSKPLQIDSLEVLQFVTKVYSPGPNSYILTPAGIVSDQLVWISQDHSTETIPDSAPFHYDPAWSKYSDEDYRIGYLASKNIWGPVSNVTRGIAICEMDDSANQVVYEGVWNRVVIPEGEESNPSYCWIDQKYVCLQEELIGCARRECIITYDDISAEWYLSGNLIASNDTIVEVDNSTDQLTVTVLKYSDYMQCCNVDDLQHPYEFIYGVSDEIHTEGNLSEFRCWNSIQTYGHCNNGTWLIEDCTYKRPICAPPNIPKFAVVVADSRYNTSYPFIIEDSIVVSCMRSAFSGDPGKNEYHKFECTETGWSPSINQTLPQFCLPGQHLSAPWYYLASTGLCYIELDLNLPNVTFDDALMLCDAGTNSTVASIGSIEFLTSMAKLGWNSNNRFWVQKDGAKCKVVYQNSVVSQDCFSTDDIDGLICERDMVFQDGWSEWSQWSQCDESLIRRRVRSCVYRPADCVDCEGESQEEDICCSDPGYGSYTLRSVRGPAFTVGTIVEYECVGGYSHPDGYIQSIICMENFTWNASALICQLVECDVMNLTTPVSANHYLFTYQYNRFYVGTYLNRICNESGFIIPSTRTRKLNVFCGPEGSWFGDNAENCIPTSCGMLPSVKNGAVSDLTRGKYYMYGGEKNLVYYGDEIVVHCDPGYHFLFSQSLVISCRENGDFTDSEPECTAIICDQAPNVTLKNAVFQTELPVKRGVNATITCHLGYGVGGKTGYVSQYVPCVQASFWNLSALKSCEEMRCTHPGNGTQIVSMTQSDKWLVGYSASYLCEHMYHDAMRKIVHLTVTCLDDTLWSGTDANCVLINCGKPENVTSNYIIDMEGTNFMDAIKYTCPPGYKIAGRRGDFIDQFYYCNERGDWSGFPLPCVQTSLYMDMRVYELNRNELKIFMVQIRSTHGIPVSYLFNFDGYNPIDGNITEIFDYTCNTSGLHYVTVKLSYGYSYRLHVTVTAELPAQYYSKVFYEEDLGSLYVPTLEPAVKDGVEGTPPELSIERLEGKSLIEVMLSFPYTNENGVVRWFSVIICEINPFHKLGYYDGKMERNLPTYYNVIKEDIRQPWGCYLATPMCNVSLMGFYECGAKPLHTDSKDIQKATFTIGTEMRCSSDNVYCNGPLKPISPFCVKLRVFTDDNYLDTRCSHVFKSAIVWHPNLLAASVLAVIPFLILCGLAVYSATTEQQISNKALESMNYLRINSNSIMVMHPGGRLEPARQPDRLDQQFLAVPQVYETPRNIPTIKVDEDDNKADTRIVYYSGRASAAKVIQQSLLFSNAIHGIPLIVIEEFDGVGIKELTDHSPNDTDEHETLDEQAAPRANPQGQDFESEVYLNALQPEDFE